MTSPVGGWLVSIYEVNDELVFRFRRKDDLPVTTWGPASYNNDHKRGTVRFRRDPNRDEHGTHLPR